VRFVNLLEAEGLDRHLHLTVCKLLRDLVHWCFLEGIYRACIRRQIDTFPDVENRLEMVKGLFTARGACYTDNPTPFDTSQRVLQSHHAHQLHHLIKSIRCPEICRSVNTVPVN
jgi:hypothetical protein